jgi:cytochrome-b5 reductase
LPESDALNLFFFAFFWCALRWPFSNESEKKQNMLWLLALVVLFAAFFFLKPSGSKPKAREVALKGPNTSVSLVLRETMEITHNTKIFRFDLPSSEARLGLPIGKHFTTHAVINGEEVSRPYTPTTSDDEIGYVDLLIKVYPQGQMSSHIFSLKPGDNLAVMGPKGMLAYEGKGNVKISGRDLHNYSQLNMVCGGTGITPMLQVIRAILKDAEDSTQVKLIFGNITEEDILLRQELEQCTKDLRIHVYFTLDRPPANWTQGTGYVTQDMMRTQLFSAGASTLTLLCGPKPMVEGCKKNLEAMGYEKNQVFNF